MNITHKIRAVGSLDLRSIKPPNHGSMQKKPKNNLCNCKAKRLLLTVVKNTCDHYIIISSSNNNKMKEKQSKRRKKLNSIIAKENQ